MSSANRVEKIYQFIIDVRVAVEVPPDVLSDPTQAPDEAQWDRVFRERQQRLVRHLLSQPKVLRKYLRALAWEGVNQIEVRDPMDLLERIARRMPNAEDASFYKKASRDGVLMEQVQDICLDYLGDVEVTYLSVSADDDEDEDEDDDEDEDEDEDDDDDGDDDEDDDDAEATPPTEGGSPSGSRSST